MTGVLLHVLCDAANNLGVITAALVIWLAKYDGRYYADPATSMGIGLMIIFSSIPLGTTHPRVNLKYKLTRIVWKSGLILLESAPNGVDLDDVQHDLEKARASPLSLSLS